MKTQELRIGNLIQQGEITMISNSNVWIDDDIFLTDEIEPIPLTEEWLLKFGFITFDSKQIYNEWFLNFDGILKYKIFHSKYTGVEEFTMPHSDKPIKLKHVHQLQNLYFALTGEELIIKNK